MSWTRGRWVLAGAAFAALAAAALLAARAPSQGAPVPEPNAYGGTPPSFSALLPPPYLFLSNRLVHPRTPAVEHLPFIWPVEGEVTQGLWERHAAGIDIAAQVGDPVRAVRDGRVVFAGGDPCCGYGLFIIIEHDEGWSSLYAHLSEARVQAGDVVAQGDVIALAGATGTVTGPHLHFELRLFGVPVDPLLYLPPGRPAPPIELLEADATTTPAFERTPAATTRPTRTPSATPAPDEPSATPMPEQPTPTPEPSPIGEPATAIPDAGTPTAEVTETPPPG